MTVLCAVIAFCWIAWEIQRIVEKVQGNRRWNRLHSSTNTVSEPVTYEQLIASGLAEPDYIPTIEEIEAAGIDVETLGLVPPRNVVDINSHRQTPAS